jgi:hypothetical protein
MEPTIGVEPMNLFLTKEALYRLSYVGLTLFTAILDQQNQANKNELERETRFELATISLEG